MFQNWLSTLRLSFLRQRSSNSRQRRKKHQPLFAEALERRDLLAASMTGSDGGDKSLDATNSELESRANAAGSSAIHGQKFHDLNADGIRQPNEPGLNNWQIELIDISTGNVVTTQLTHDMDLNGDGQIDPITEQGLYWFEGLTKGCYFVQEILQTDWTQTYPGPPPTTGFTAIRIGDVDGIGYGDAAGYFRATSNPATLPANVDGLGVLQAGDHLPDLGGPNDNATQLPLPDPARTPDGVTAYTHGDDFDLRSAAEFAGSSLTGSGYTDIASDGSQWTDIALSTSYRDAVSLHDTDGNGNDFDTFPDSNGTAAPNQPGFQFDFFVAAGDITPGTPHFFNVVFGDFDVGNAKIDVTRADGTTSEFTLVQQADHADGLIQASFAKLDFDDVFTPVAGGYHGWLSVDVQADTEPYMAYDYVELSVAPIALNPNAPGHAITLGDGDVLTGIDFGNTATSGIHGQKFYDMNGDGVRDPIDPGWDGITIEVIDANTNTVVASQVTHSMNLDADPFIDPATEQGLFWFSLPPGTYFVQEVLTGGLAQTYPVGGTYTIELQSGDVVEDVLFGNTSSGIGNFRLGEVHGCKFEDLDGDGQHDPGEPGMPGIEIELLQYNSNTGQWDVVDTTLTMANGEYWFMGLGPGYYQVQEVTPPDMVQTTIPLPPFQLHSGQIVVFGDCGDHEPELGSIHGQKFFDADGDRRQGVNEPGLDGWSIVVTDTDGNVVAQQTTMSMDINADGVIDPQTEQGWYWIEDLPAGTYTVSEVMQSGWQQTLPGSPGMYTITLATGETLEDVDFGNRAKLDFGDAPEPTYPTIYTSTNPADQGARHMPIGPRLGERVDAEPNGQPNGTANGDDLDGNDDEDGVNQSQLAVMVPGALNNVDVYLTHTSSAWLDVWFDLDGNPGFHPSDQVSGTSILLQPGINTIDVFVPESAADRKTFARFRVSTDGGLSPIGLAIDGEVEDHSVKVLPLQQPGDTGDDQKTRQESDSETRTSEVEQSTFELSLVGRGRADDYVEVSPLTAGQSRVQLLGEDGSVLVDRIIQTSQRISLAGYAAGNYSLVVDGSLDDYVITPAIGTEVGEPKFAALDFDGSGDFSAATDGLQLLAYALGNRAAALETLRSPGDTRSGAEIDAAISKLSDALDLDGDGEFQVASDGITLLAYMLGIRGDRLADYSGSNATRTGQQIETRLEGLLACAHKPAQARAQSADVEESGVAAPTEVRGRHLPLYGKPKTKTSKPVSLEPEVFLTERDAGDVTGTLPSDPAEVAGRHLPLYARPKTKTSKAVSNTNGSSELDARFTADAKSDVSAEDTGLSSGVTAVTTRLDSVFTELKHSGIN